MDFKRALVRPQKGIFSKPIKRLFKAKRPYIGFKMYENILHTRRKTKKYLYSMKRKKRYEYIELQMFSYFCQFVNFPFFMTIWHYIFILWWHIRRYFLSTHLTEESKLASKKYIWKFSEKIYKLNIFLYLCVYYPNHYISSFGGNHSLMKIQRLSDKPHINIT